jgi:hypothetical protein
VIFRILASLLSVLEFAKYARQRKYPMKTLIIVTITFLSLTSTAIAQNTNDWQSWPLADHFTVSLNAMFPNLDTRVRLDASDGSPGTTIDFEQNLGMSDTETLPGIDLGWRFAKKHQLNLTAFKLDRSGSDITTTEIRFGDEVFPVDLPISSFLDMDITSIKYSYSLIFDERKEVAVSLGLSVQDITFGLMGNVLGIIEVESGITAPVPTIGLDAGYAFTDKWIGRIGFGALSFDLALSDEDELSGEIFNWYATIQHNTFEHVHFGLSFTYFDLRVDWKESGLINSVGYEYYGPVLTVRAAF